MSWPPYDAMLDACTDEPPTCGRCGQRPAYAGETTCAVCLADIESLPDLPASEEDIMAPLRRVVGS